MIIMATRLKNLVYIVAGFIKTEVPLVGFDGESLLPFLGFDDIGIYILIPKLVRFFNISIEQAINFFFYGIIASGFFFGILGFFLLYKTFLTRLVACAGLLFLAYFIRRYDVGDVYSAYLAAALGVIPLTIYFIKEKWDSSLFYYFFFFAGIALGTLHYIRSFSGLATLVFMAVILVGSKHILLKKKLILTCTLLGGLACPYSYFTNTIYNYEQYAHQQFKANTDFPTVHPFWHTIYLGFGFLNFENKDKIQLEDEYAFDKVQQIAPSISLQQTNDYETILKNEVYTLFKTRPFFIFFTIFAKLGILFFYLLLFGNLGLLALFLRIKQWNIELAFYSSALVTMLFPLLTLPNYWYSIGFITVTTLYNIMSINELLLTINFKKLITLNLDIFRRKNAAT